MKHVRDATVNIDIYNLSLCWDNTKYVSTYEYIIAIALEKPECIRYFNNNSNKIIRFYIMEILLTYSKF